MGFVMGAMLVQVAVRAQDSTRPGRRRVNRRPSRLGPAEVLRLRVRVWQADGAAYGRVAERVGETAMRLSGDRAPRSTGTRRVAFAYSEPATTQEFEDNAQRTPLRRAPLLAREAR
jgi:hypothetical protein